MSFCTATCMKKKKVMTMTNVSGMSMLENAKQVMYVLHTYICPFYTAKSSKEPVCLKVPRHM